MEMVLPVPLPFARVQRLAASNVQASLWLTIAGQLLACKRGFVCTCCHLSAVASVREPTEASGDDTDAFMNVIIQH